MNWTGGMPMWFEPGVGMMGSVASLLGLLAGWGWWRVHQLVRRDRERAMKMLNPYEMYAHILYAVRVLDEEHRQDVERHLRARTARDGLLRSCTILTTVFKAAHPFPMNHSCSLVRIADEHLAHGDVLWAEACYELGHRLLYYDFSDPESRHREQRDELQACLMGLQECAVNRGHRNRAHHWLREARSHDLKVKYQEEDIDGPGFELRGWAARLRLKLRRLREARKVGTNNGIRRGY